MVNVVDLLVTSIKKITSIKRSPMSSQATTTQSVVVSLFLIICGASAITIYDGNNGQYAAKLLQSTANDYVMIFQGDTQYWFPCTGTNVNCKAQSQAYRTFYHITGDECYLDPNVAKQNGWNDQQRHDIMEQCKKIEGTWANNLQSAVIKDLIATLLPAHQPRALVYAGDLTDFGRSAQRDNFQSQWMGLIDVRMYPGLGNHDYQNNVGKCDNNECANRMLYWLVEFGKKYNLNMDYVKGTRNGKTTYTGSFAYSKDLCTHTGNLCAKIIQLNNRPDYSVSFESAQSYWTVTPSISWLYAELQKVVGTNMPVFITLHHLENNLQTISNTIRTLGLKNRIFVTYAHAHDKQEVGDVCSGIQVPFMYVGSVPNNRFTAIKISANSPTDAEIFLMEANTANSATILQYKKEYFTPC